MAKKTNNTPGQPQNSKLKIFYAELDGTPQTIEEALRTVSKLRQPLVIQAPAAPRIDELVDAPTAEPNLFDQSQNGTDEATAQVQESDDSQNEEATRQPRGSGPKVDRNAGLEVVHDLDFVPSEDTSLKDFFVEKTPKTDMEKILVICWFFQEKNKLEVYGLNHIYTALKHLPNLSIPKDLGATVRNMKKDKVWLKYSKPDNIRVATEGENHINHSLPASAK